MQDIVESHFDDRKGRWSYHPFDNGAEIQYEVRDGKLVDVIYFIVEVDIYGIKFLEEEIEEEQNGYKNGGYMADGGKMARGGMVVTSIKDIPNFQQRLDEGKITYRGLGMGKLSDDFYDLAGTHGVRIKVDKKEYYITDKEFDTFSRDANGKVRIRFDAPYKKSYDDGGMMAKGGEMDYQYMGEPHKLDEFENGGEIAEQNTEMLMSLNHQIEHHAKEIGEILTDKTPVMAWVLAKAERAASDLSDIAHYLDGEKQAHEE